MEMRYEVWLIVFFLAGWSSCVPIKTVLPSPVGPAPKKYKIDPGPRCSPRFSELKFCWNKEVCYQPFIELLTRCEKRPGPVPKNALADYVLIVIQGTPPALAMVADLEKFPFDGSGNFLVVGDPDVPNVDLSTATPHVQTTFSKTDEKLTLPVPFENAYSVLILQGVSKSEKKGLNLNFNAQGNYIPRLLTTDQVKLIAQTAIDMVFLGETSTVKLMHFESFWKNKNTPMFSDVWMKVVDEPSNMGLSICKVNFDGFDAAAFEIKPESPGEKNLCELPDNEVMGEDIQMTPAENEDDDRKLMHSISDEQLVNIKSFSFRPEWVEKCSNKFPPRGNILSDPHVQDWIDFGEEDCKFTCKTCTSYLGLGFRPDVKFKPKVLTTGFLSNDIYDNSDAIKAHSKYPLHLESYEFFSQMKDTGSLEDAMNVIRNFEDKEKEIFNATMNVIMVLYAEIKAGVPFQTHATLMNGIRRIGANVGTLQHSSDASQTITKIISESFHLQLLQHLVENQTPFSIMVDSSTSFSLPFLSVYIQTLEDQYPVTHFYALIHMGRGEKAREMTDSLIEQIQQDNDLVPGFEQYFKSKLVSYSSDGASVMVGKKKSFKVDLKTYVGRPIPNIVCLAHKLDISFKKGVKPEKKLIEVLEKKPKENAIKIWQYSYFETFEKSSNELYAFYSSRGYKRWQHFVQTAEEMGIDPVRYKYVHVIRWSESHFCVLETVHHNYYAVVEDCDRISRDKDFEDHVRLQAEKYHARMTDKTYMLVLHEFLDILGTFKLASKKFQKASATIVGKIDVVYEVLTSLNDYKNNLGSWLQDFLKATSCNRMCIQGDCTLQQFDRCPKVSLNGLTLSNNDKVIMPYSDVRSELYSNLANSIKKNFNMPMMEAFEVFNPKRINFQINLEEISHPTFEDLYVFEPETATYRIHLTSSDRMNHILKFYNFDSQDFAQINVEWIELLKCLVKSIGVNSAPEESILFWPLALTLCNSNWTPATKEIVNFVMVTPFSSSEVERGFSIMNSIKTKGRVRMDKQTLNAVMRARINGPSVEDFNVYKYTIQVLKRLSRADDPTFKGGKRTANEKLPGFFDRSRIYNR